MKSKVLASILATAFVPVTVLSVASSAYAAEAAKEAQCNVHAVLAVKEGDGTIPADLKFLEAQLRDDQFAVYKKFVLLETKSAKVALDKAAKLEFTSGNSLTLGLVGSDDTRLKLKLELSNRDNSKSLLNAAVSATDAAAIIIDADAYTQGGTAGKLLFAIQCARTT
jgi:hypothetical protein